MSMMKNTGPIFLVQVCCKNLSFTANYTNTFFGGFFYIARNLIDKLLTFDPNTRITAEEALLHPWITGTGSKEAGPRTSTNLAPTIRKGYSSRGSFTAIALMNQCKTSEDSSSGEERKSEEIKKLDITA